MVLNEELDFCFYHIMKCGGTSIRRVLNSHPASVDSKRMLVYKHTEIRWWPKHIPSNRIFTFVRNPWERFHSLYWDIKSRFLQMHLKENPNPIYKKWYKAMYDEVETMEFSDWIMRGRYIHPAEYGYNAHPINALEKSMSYYLEGPYDITVFRLEDGHEPLEDFLDHRFSFDRHDNKSKRPDSYTDAYTSEAKDRVWEVCREDARLWNYEF